MNGGTAVRIRLVLADDLAHHRRRVALSEQRRVGGAPESLTVETADFEISLIDKRVTRNGERRFG